MIVYSKEFQKEVNFKRIGSYEGSANNSLIEIDGDEVWQLAKERFMMYPIDAYIRTTPDDGDWLVFHFKGYKSEGRMRVKLNGLEFLR